MPAQAKAAVVGATGDETIRTNIYHIANNRSCSLGYIGRVVRNEFVKKWHAHEEELEQVRAEELKALQDGVASGTFDVGNTTMGEAIGVVHDIPQADDVINRMVAETKTWFAQCAPCSVRCSTSRPIVAG